MIHVIVVPGMIEYMQNIHGIDPRLLERQQFVSETMNFGQLAMTVGGIELVDS